jgi:hypothetical protein
MLQKHYIKYHYLVGLESPFAIRDESNSCGYTWDITGLIEEVLSLKDEEEKKALLTLINKDFPNHLDNQLDGLRFSSMPWDEYHSERSYIESLIGGMELALGFDGKGCYCG